jgi:choline dehydrogenase
MTMLVSRSSQDYDQVHMTKSTTHSNVKYTGPPHSAPGTVNHQLVCFNYLFVEAPNPQVQQRSLAGVSSGHVAGIGCNLNKPTSSSTITITSFNPTISPPLYPTTSIPPLTGNQLMNWSVLAMVSSVRPPCNLCWNHPLTSATPLSIQTPSSTNTFTHSHVTSTYHFRTAYRMASCEKGGVVDQSGRVY